MRIPWSVWFFILYIVGALFVIGTGVLEIPYVVLRVAGVVLVSWVLFDLSRRVTSEEKATVEAAKERVSRLFGGRYLYWVGAALLLIGLARIVAGR